MIKVLVIGSTNWIDRTEANLLSGLNFPTSIEKISNEETARERLTHNSYDVLLLQDNFIDRTIDLTKLAYAMTRPSIIICNSFVNRVKYMLWRTFSRFSRHHKIASKLIHFADESDRKHIEQLILFLAYNHLQYFTEINKEFSLL